MQFRALNKCNVAAGALAACLSTVGTSAHAGLILTLSDGTNTTTVSDGSAGDLNPLAGAVVFSGSLGAWIVNVATGISKPIIGTPQTDEMHLNSVNVTGQTAGTITVTLEDDGFSKLDATWVSAIGGVTSGTIESQTFIDGALVASYTTSGPGAFSDTQSGQVNATAPYSMKLVGIITHTGGYQASSFDYVVSVPEPGSLALMAGGLLGLVLLRRRRLA